MEKYRSKDLVTISVTLLSFWFTVLSVIPIIMPSLVAYVFGSNKHRYKTLYGLSSIHFLISMLAGELIFFMISSFVINYIMDFYNPRVFWYIVIAGFISNYLFSVIFYFLGSYRAKIKKANKFT